MVQESFKRQSIRHLIVAVIAMIIGAINNLYIFSDHLELKGKYDFIVNTSYIVAIVAAMGLPTLTNKYLPLFKTEDNKDHGFLTVLLLLGLVFSFIFFVSLSGFLWANPLKLGDQNEYLKYGHFILLIAAIMVNIHVIAKYLNARRTVDIPLAIMSLLNKVLIGLLVLAVGIGAVYYSFYEIGIIIVFVLQLLIFFIFLARRHGVSLVKIDFGFFKANRPPDLLPFLVSGLFMSISYSVLDKIDHSMLGSMVGFKENGIYGINNYISGLVLIPYVSAFALYGYTISKLMTEKKYELVAVKYKQTSDYLFIIGGSIFLLIWANLDILIMISPKMTEVLSYRYLLLILAIGHLINMVFSINEHILVYGDYFRINNILVALMIGINVLLNYLLIPVYNVYGAAIATMISFGVFNLAKSWFVYRQYHMNVIDKRTVAILTLGIISFTMVEIIELKSTILNSLINTTIVGLTFIAPVLKFRLSEIISKTVDDTMLKWTR
jgi:O-antigen/teichoic acid export membrane protein